MRVVLVLAVALWTCAVVGAGRSISFEADSAGGLPKGFSSVLLGHGKAGEWRVIAEDGGPEKEIVAQMSRELLGQRFPVLLMDEVVADFKLSIRFKIVAGTLEQSAGLVFRYQNPSNYFVVRADALANSFRCFKVENGLVKPAIGPEVPVTKNEWHTLVVQSEGTRILCALNGQELVKLIDSTARRTGRIGLWTKSDTIAQFASLRMNYTPHEPIAKALVRDALRDYPRVLDLSIFARRAEETMPVIIASKQVDQIGTPGSVSEAETIKTGNRYFGRSKDAVIVVLPLRDRNGDPMAAVRVRMKAFPGQTEDNAVIRAQPIVKAMEGRAQTLEELLE
ncbi:MAG TPA: family 16 glycoside hydrolase [Verrucomicrobiae bacterium]|nr:family 16 glycoside hydrolase [Verrucomicrobiae bacterium]